MTCLLDNKYMSLLGLNLSLLHLLSVPGKFHIFLGGLPPLLSGITYYHVSPLNRVRGELSSTGNNGKVNLE